MLCSQGDEQALRETGDNKGSQRQSYIIEQRKKCVENPNSTILFLVHCNECVLVTFSTTTEFIPQPSLMIKNRNKDHLGNGRHCEKGRHLRQFSKTTQFSSSVINQQIFAICFCSFFKVKLRRWCVQWLRARVLEPESQDGVLVL